MRLAALSMVRWCCDNYSSNTKWFGSEGSVEGCGHFHRTSSADRVNVLRCCYDRSVLQKTAAMWYSRAAAIKGNAHAQRLHPSPCRWHGEQVNSRSSSALTFVRCGISRRNSNACPTRASDHIDLVIRDSEQRSRR